MLTALLSMFTFLLVFFLCALFPFLLFPCASIGDKFRACCPERLDHTSCSFPTQVLGMSGNYHTSVHSRCWECLAAYLCPRTANCSTAAVTLACRTRKAPGWPSSYTSSGTCLSRRTTSYSWPAPTRALGAFH